VSEAILIAAHAITAKLDSMETNQLAALGDLRDSVDCAASGMAADSDEISDMRKLIAYLAKMEAEQPEVMRELRKRRGEVPPPTEHERELMYRALEADYLANNTPASIEKLDAALCRFKTLSGY
jgi:DNA-binding FadR family transcriptional regulator